jgi:hypothetical protein
LDQKAASSPGNTHNAENMIELTAKRLQDSAQGFNPGYRFTSRLALKGRKVGLGRLDRQSTTISRLTNNLWRHFQGASFSDDNPGLKPWAKSYNRFAVNSTHSSPGLLTNPGGKRVIQVKYL